MAWWMKTNLSDKYEMMYVFANTGQEHPDTYRFLEDVNRHILDGELIMVEAEVIFGKKESSSFRVVNQNSMSRDGRPYEDVIKKYGVPNNNMPHCTREMKFNTISAYTESVWGKNYIRAIGIRADETRRVKKDAVEQGIIYPLVDIHPTTKEEVLDWFSQFPWDLKIPEFLGNCVFCFKKSMEKLNAVWWDDPKHFDFPARMEEELGHIKPEKLADRDSKMTFFRGGHSTLSLSWSCSKGGTMITETAGNRMKRPPEPAAKVASRFPWKMLNPGSSVILICLNC